MNARKWITQQAANSHKKEMSKFSRCVFVANERSQLSCQFYVCVFNGKSVLQTEANTLVTVATETAAL